MVSTWTFTSKVGSVKPNEARTFSGLWAWFLHTIQGSKSRPKVPTLPQHNPRNIQASQTAQGELSQQENMHLMSCMRKGKYGKMLHPDAIGAIGNDRQLMEFLRQIFLKHRGKIKNFFSFQEIQTLALVKVSHKVSRCITANNPVVSTSPRRSHKRSASR